MGANQSSDSGGGSNATGRRGVGRRTCYYELLDISKDASEGEIKKAYRKKALELHPDRNYGNVEASTNLFSAVQSAYEVLSDQQEREWYDDHRESILQDDDEVEGEQDKHDARVTTAGDIMRLFKRFNSQKDFSDSVSGFYGGLRQTFDSLAREEEVACEWEGLEGTAYPSFGSAGDSYDAVVKPFYAMWAGFATQKKFSWKDLYRYAEAPDRRVRRMMEKENKRSRDEGIREFNDAVRSLVRFVKRRDPRVTVNERDVADRQRILREAAAGQAARSRAANYLKHLQPSVVADWAQSSGPLEDDTSAEAGIATVKEEYECMVCRKTFKSEKQYNAHEKSKKHVKAVQQIWKDMRRDDAKLNLGSSSRAEPSSPPEPDGDVDGTETDTDRLPAHSSSEGFPHSQESRTPLNEDSTLRVSAHTDESISQPTLSVGSWSDSEDNECASREKVESRILNSSECNTAIPSQPNEDKADEVAKQLAAKTLTEKRKTGKAKEKRAKKAAQKSITSGAVDTEFECTTCQANFSSKTRLFNHIKDFGHAQSMSKASKGGKGKKR